MTYNLRFKTGYGYKNFSKVFNSELHFERFVDKMAELYNWSLVGITKDDGGEDQLRGPNR